MFQKSGCVGGVWLCEHTPCIPCQDTHGWSWAIASWWSDLTEISGFTVFPGKARNRQQSLWIAFNTYYAFYFMFCVSALVAVHERLHLKLDISCRKIKIMWGSKVIISVTYSCVTNHTRTQCLNTAAILVSSCSDSSSAGLRCNQSWSYVQLVVGLGFWPEPQISSSPCGLSRWLAWCLRAWWS